MIGRIIGLFVTIMIAVTVYPVIQEQTNPEFISSLTNQTLSQSNTTILNLLPLFFALTVITSAIGILFSLIRDAGLMEDYGEEYKEEEKKGIPHKQTYEEYVRERLRIERMIRSRFWRWYYD